jgi:hypothetical protein
MMPPSSSVVSSSSVSSSVVVAVTGLVQAESDAAKKPLPIKQLSVFSLFYSLLFHKII